MFGLKMAPEPVYEPLWQLLHVMVLTAVWFIVTLVVNACCDLWQLSHLAVLTWMGMWLDGLPLAVLPLWQLSQVPVPTALAAECV